MILGKMERAGLELQLSPAGKLRVAGELNDRQRSYIKEHKQQLILALRLRPIAKQHGHPLDDLLDWYKDDVEDLSTMTDEDLRFVVSEYLGNQGVYRHCKPVPYYVRCIDCDHFTRRDDHPHLGCCSAGVKPSAACGMFWDTDARGCRKFTQQEQ